MKNSIYFKYCVNKELLDLLGVKQKEILEINTFHLDIIFERYGNKYKIDIDTTYQKDELKLQVARKYNIYDWSPHLFILEGVTSDKDFAKFRRLMDEFVIDTIVINCKENDTN